MIFWAEYPIFGDIIQKILQYHAGTPKRHFVLTTFWDEITFAHITR